MTFLYRHLEEGSFKTAYADTDSMCLGLTKTDLQGTYSTNKEEQLRALFDPIVRPEMKESWEKLWKTWFVTTTAVEDLREPGKLKGIFIMMCISLSMI